MTDGERLRTWREKRGLTQAQLASRLDPKVNQPTVARWESGVRRIPAGLWNALSFMEGEEREEELEQVRGTGAVMREHLLEAYWIASSLSDLAAADDLKWHLDQIMDLADEIADTKGLRHVAAIVPLEYSRRRR